MKAGPGRAWQLQMEENKEKQYIKNPTKHASSMLFNLQSKGWLADFSTVPIHISIVMQTKPVPIHLCKLFCTSGHLELGAPRGE